MRVDRLVRPGVLVLISILALLVPVMLVGVPPLLDYPNHFARMWLIAGGVAQAPLSGMYAVDWSIASTNIGVDLLAASLGRLVGADVLGHGLVAAALVLPAAGAVLLNRAVFGGSHWWQVGFAGLVWNSTLLAGFLSFQVGLGLALLAAAADPVLERRAGVVGAFAVRAGFGALLLVFHVFAAAFYAALVAGLAFGAGRGLVRAVGRGVLAGGIALGVPLAGFLLVVPVVPGGQAPAGAFDIWAGYTVINKVITLMSAVVTYDFRLDALFVLALWGMARVLPLLAGGRGAGRAQVGLRLVGVGLVALAVAVPSVLGGTAGVDWRFPVMAMLTLAAAVRPGLATARGAAVAGCVLLGLSLARTGWIAEIWMARQADVASVGRALARVPAGAAVLPMQNTAQDVGEAPRGRYLLAALPTFWHYPALAVPWRHAFVPTLFTTRGKQPLRVLPPWDAISVPEGMPAPLAFLGGFEPLPALVYNFGYVTQWRTRFDYMLVVNADMVPESGRWDLPEGLELMADEGFARLYRIRRGG